MDEGFPRLLRFHGQAYRFVQGFRHPVQVAGFQTALDREPIHLHGDDHPFVQGDRQGLGASHPAQSGGDGEGVFQGSPEVAPGALGKGFIGPCTIPWLPM